MFFAAMQEASIPGKQLNLGKNSKPVTFKFTPVPSPSLQHSGNLKDNSLHSSTSITGDRMNVI